MLLGTIGLAVPGLPTTPFLLLAAACFFRSSQKLYDRVLRNPTFGPPIQRFRETGGLPKRVKLLAISTMSVFVTVGVVFGLPAGRWDLKGTVIVLALIGVLYLLRLPTVEEPRSERDPSSPSG